MSQTTEIVVEVLQWCGLLGIGIFLLWVRAAIAEERRRARAQAQSIEQRLVKMVEDTALAAAAATERVANDLAETDHLAKDTETRVREAELRLLRSVTQYEHLVQRIDLIGERVERCATRDDIAQLSGLLERLAGRMERFIGASEQHKS